jgi:hypothetical protein
LQKSVAEEQADSLRLLIVVGGHGAFVAAFRDLPQITLAHLYPQFAEPAALGARAAPAFARPMSPWLSPPVASMVHENRSQGLNGPRGTYYPWQRPCRSADRQAQATAVEQRAGPH